MRRVVLLVLALLLAVPALTFGDASLLPALNKCGVGTVVAMSGDSAQGFYALRQNENKGEVVRCRADGTLSVIVRDGDSRLPQGGTLLPADISQGWMTGDGESVYLLVWFRAVALTADKKIAAQGSTIMKATGNTAVQAFLSFGHVLMYTDSGGKLVPRFIQGSFGLQISPRMILGVYTSDSYPIHEVSQGLFDITNVKSIQLLAADVMVWTATRDKYYALTAAGIVQGDKSGSKLLFANATNLVAVANGGNAYLAFKQAGVQKFVRIPDSGTQSDLLAGGKFPVGDISSLAVSADETVHCLVGGNQYAKLANGQVTSVSLTGKAAGLIESSNNAFFTIGGVPYTLVQPTPPPSGTFTANPLSITESGSSQLCWSVKDTTSVSSTPALDPPIGSTEFTGCRNAAPKATTVYNLDLKGSGGTLRLSATIAVTPALPVPVITKVAPAFYGVEEAPAQATPEATPESWVSVYGSDLATAFEATYGLPATRWSATEVTVCGAPTRLQFVSPSQVNLQISPTQPLGSCPVIARRLDWNRVSTPFILNIVASSPALATYAPDTSKPAVQMLIAQKNGTTALVSDDSPPASGDTLVLYGLGLGPVDRATPYDDFGNPTITANLVLPVQATINGAPAKVLYAGTTGFAGLFQVNLEMPPQIPEITTPGLPDLIIWIGNKRLVFPKFCVK